MKFKTTKKDVMRWNSKVICLGYCSAQNLLSGKDPIAYTSGVYGWNADIYTFDNVAIVTGYRPFGNIRVNYETMNEFEKQAEKIRFDYSLDYDTRKNMIDNLLKDFIGTVTA